MDIKKWFSETSKSQVTDSTIADILNVTRKTANKRVNEGLSADDLIEISRHLGIPPIHALVELGKLTPQEVFDYLDGDGTLLASASVDQLLYHLAEESLPLSARIELGIKAKMLSDRKDELAARRAKKEAEHEPAPEPERYVAKTKQVEPSEGDDDFGA